MNSLGYTHPLFILAFDHRATFYKHLFKLPENQITQEQHAKITEFKSLIFEAVKQALGTIPLNEAAILVDEQYGDQVLQEAKHMGLWFALSTEKSGQKEFAFEYGDEFGEHIKKYQPTFAKALIHYNPQDSEDLKMRQQRELKKLSDWCCENKYKFLLEVLVDATEQQLLEVANDHTKYDAEIRPKLSLQLVKELQDAGVEPDVWKMEGMEKQADYEKVVAQIQSGDRKAVSLVVLGRGATDEKVAEWLRVGAQVLGVIGFAVGRTIFWDALISYERKIWSRAQTVTHISQKFITFYEVFKKTT